MKTSEEVAYELFTSLTIDEVEGNNGNNAIYRFAKALTAYAEERISEHQIKCINEHADAKRLIEWIANDERPALTAFTEGPDRQVGYAVERYAEERVKDRRNRIMAIAGKVIPEERAQARAEALEQAATFIKFSSIKDLDRLAKRVRDLKAKP